MAAKRHVVPLPAFRDQRSQPVELGRGYVRGVKAPGVVAAQTVARLKHVERHAAALQKTKGDQAVGETATDEGDVHGGCL